MSINAISSTATNDTVVLRGIPIGLSSDIGRAFVADCSRNRERLLSDDAICEKYGLSPDAWVEIALSKPVKLATNAEHDRRVRNGTAAQESAAKLFAEAPQVLGTILNDQSASPRHRIEAARELRATANAGTDQTSSHDEKYVININLGADRKLRIAKRIRPLTPEEAAKNIDIDAEENAETHNDVNTE
jgi:hypothetical protein